ncbi:hypothetical protein [Variovorax sp. JS1663]|nr:hypothetical protein [Variovorax sp. JS1663]
MLASARCAANQVFSSASVLAPVFGCDEQPDRAPVLLRLADRG